VNHIHLKVHVIGLPLEKEKNALIVRIPKVARLSSKSNFIFSFYCDRNWTEGVG